jgi:hypothetical protein
MRGLIPPLKHTFFFWSDTPLSTVTIVPLCKEGSTLLYSLYFPIYIVSRAVINVVKLHGPTKCLVGKTFVSVHNKTRSLEWPASAVPVFPAGLLRNMSSTCTTSFIFRLLYEQETSGVPTERTERNLPDVF